MSIDLAKVARLLLSLSLFVSLSTFPGRASSIHCRARSIHIWGHVAEQHTGKPVEAARIRVLPSTDHVAWRTDAKGEFSFWVAKQTVDRIEIEADGYANASLVSRTGAFLDVRLTPETLNVSTPLHATGTYVSSLMPASQSVAPAIMTADSGGRPSGRGSRWSPWYRLGAKAPAGYTVNHVEFWLSGDGACGRSAECRQLVGTDEQVLWEFRLHGHEEIGAPSQTLSVAHIRVMFRPR